MSDKRKQMDQAIKKIVVPMLRKKKFKGTFPHFYRLRNSHIDLLTFQFSSSGGKFVVEISYADQKRKNVYSEGENLALEKLRVMHTIDRLRLGSRPEEGIQDHWFQFDKNNFFSRNSSFEDITKEVLPLLETQAEEWWSSKYIS